MKKLIILLVMALVLSVGVNAWEIKGSLSPFDGTFGREEHISRDECTLLDDLGQECLEADGHAWPKKPTDAPLERTYHTRSVLTTPQFIGGHLFSWKLVDYSLDPQGREVLV